MTVWVPGTISFVCKSYSKQKIGVLTNELCLNELVYMFSTYNTVGRREAIVSPCSQSL